MKRLYVFITVMLVVCLLHAQVPYLSIPSKDVRKLERRIVHLARKQGLKKSSYRICNVYYVWYDGEDCRDVINHEEIQYNSLQVNYYRLGLFNGGKYLYSETFLYDNNNDVVAYGDSRFLTTAFSFDKSEERLPRTIIEKQYRVVFQFAALESGSYIAVDRDGQVFVLRKKLNGLDIYTLSDYFDAYPDEPACVQRIY